MERKKIIIGNWKMKLNLGESVRLAKGLVKAFKKYNRAAEVVACPSFVSLVDVAEILVKSKIQLGAQDVFWEAVGAFTGEVSPQTLQEVNCRYVVLGHSERRTYLGETDQMVHQKVKAVLDHKMSPVVCVGETLEQRQEKQQDYVVIGQVTKALEGIAVKPNDKITVAYEPVWVIGSGRPVAPSEALHMHQLIRQTLIDIFPLDVVQQNFRIIYGGSIDAENVSDYSSLELVDGFLVGG
ncbi:MAG: triose-phosphate isomerase, partial [Candidatus Buchananbacteria bacterium CG10_big_fil_rev_8_21_14_0_10_42_9]